MFNDSKLLWFLICLNIVGFIFHLQLDSCLNFVLSFFVPHLPHMPLCFIISEFSWVHLHGWMFLSRNYLLKNTSSKSGLGYFFPTTAQMLCAWKFDNEKWYMVVKCFYKSPHLKSSCDTLPSINQIHINCTMRAHWPLPWFFRPTCTGCNIYHGKIVRLWYNMMEGKRVQRNRCYLPGGCNIMPW